MNLLILSGILIEKPKYERIEPGITVCHGVIAVQSECMEEYEYHLFIAFDEEAKRIKNCSEEFMPVQLTGELKNYKYTFNGTEKNFSCLLVKESEFSINCTSQKETVELQKKMMHLRQNEKFFEKATEYWKMCMWHNGAGSGQ